MFGLNHAFNTSSQKPFFGGHRFPIADVHRARQGKPETSFWWSHKVATKTLRRNHYKATEKTRSLNDMFFEIKLNLAQLIAATVVTPSTSLEDSSSFVYMYDFQSL
jgi:hypothetical protein